MSTREPAVESDNADHGRERTSSPNPYTLGHRRTPVNRLRSVALIESSTPASGVTHQMTLNGTRDGFEVADFVACARNAAMKRGRAAEILREVQDAVSRWREFAEEAGVPDDTARAIAAAHRTGLLP